MSSSNTIKRIGLILGALLLLCAIFFILLINSESLEGKIILESEELQVEQITIDHQIHSVPFYAMPELPKDIAKLIKFPINLTDVSAIVPWISPESTKKIFKIDNREFIEVRVLWHDKIKQANHFLVERKAKIFCIESSSNQKREFAFEDILELKIVSIVNSLRISSKPPL